MKKSYGLHVILWLIGILAIPLTMGAQCAGYCLRQTISNSIETTTLFSINLTSGESVLITDLDLPQNCNTLGLVDSGENLFSIYNQFSGSTIDHHLIKMDYSGNILESTELIGIVGFEGDLEYDYDNEEIIVVTVGGLNDNNEDNDNHIYRVSESGSVVTVGYFNDGPDSGFGAGLLFYGNDPSGMALDADGNLIVSMEGQGIPPNQGQSFIKFFSINLNGSSPLPKTQLGQLPINLDNVVLGMTYNTCSDKIVFTCSSDGTDQSTDGAYLLEVNPNGSDLNTIGELSFSIISEPLNSRGITGLTAHPTPCEKVEVPKSQTRCSSDPQSEIFAINIQDGGQGGSWSATFGADFGNENNPSTTVTGLNLGVNVLTWFDNCTQEEYQVAITILDAPELVLSAFPSFSLCEDEFLSVTAMPDVVGATYIFNRCPLPILANGPNNVYQAGPQYSGEIGVAVIYPNGCRARACEKVTREDCCDDVVIPEDMSFCELKATYVEIDILGSEGGQGGTWTASDQGVVFDDPNAFNTTVDEFEFGTTTLTWYDNCNDEEYSFTVTVLETIELTVTANPTATPCEGEQISVSIPVDAGASVAWGMCDSPPLFGGSLPGSASWNPSNQQGSASFQATVSLDNGCEATDCVDVIWQDCECPEADQVDFEDIITCPSEVDTCITAPPGYIIIGVYVNGSDDNELNSTQTQYCLDDYGTYTVELQNAASGCTYTDDFDYTEADGCCEVFPDFTTTGFTPDLCQIISFSNTSTAGPGTQIIGYTWDYGDGLNGSTEETPGFQFYTNDGTYTIELTVAGIDEHGNCCTATAEQVVDIDCNCDVVSSFGVSSNDCDVDFNATSTPGFQATIISYEWHMGDGTVLFGENVDYTYSNSGDYSVTLITTALSGSNTCSDEMTQTVSVTCEPTIQCDIDAQIDLFQHAILDNFLSDVSLGSGTTILGYQWSIDGTDVGTGPDHTVFPSLSNGTYEVCLTVLGLSGGDCCTQEFCETFVIGNPAPGQENSSSFEDELEPQLAQTINLAPNPSKEYTQVLLQNLTSQEVIDLQVYDTNGNTIEVPIDKQNDSISIGTSSLATGTYIVMVRTSTSLMAETLIVE